MPEEYRIAVIDREKCKYRDCDRPCIRYCPRVRSGEAAIEDTGDRIVINEELCIGCGICIKKCPYDAIRIVNLSHEVGTPVHQYGKNTFRLYGLPVPSKGVVVGLLGPNGIGKTTSFSILSGNIRPNLGNWENPPGEDDIIRHFRGSELQKYFIQLYKENAKTVLKPQQVDKIPKVVRGRVKELLKDERGKLEEVVEALALEKILDRDVSKLSGGELQRIAIAAAMLKDVDYYFFDEPSSFLDVEQRIRMARAIRSLAEEGKGVLVVEHDLAVMDILADSIHIIHGEEGVYGVVSRQLSARRGINAYLDGFLREENVRFRDEAISFKVGAQRFKGEVVLVEWPRLEKRLGSFHLVVHPGSLYQGEIVSVFGPNGIGKTTFARMLAGEIEPDNTKLDYSAMISYKPQYLSTTFVGTVRELLSTVVDNVDSKEYRAEILRPLDIERLMDRQVQNLSGGELQRVAICLALSREAPFVLLDEPSAYLDVEQRIRLARAIRRHVEKTGKTCLVIDHDLLLLDYIGDRVMRFSGVPGERGECHPPERVYEGMNKFLKTLGVTFREEPSTGRPRANKPGSQKDQEQKKKGLYYMGRK